jgi:dihydropteroate synthase
VSNLSSLPEITDGDASGLYLRPLCAAMSHGSVAATIGGAWAGFDGVEVVLRKGPVVSTAQCPVPDLHIWAAAQALAVKDRVETLFARITEPRPPFAGIDLASPRIMGVLNVTPDSFSDGGDYATPPLAIARARDLANSGAVILDIGGESTRPGSDMVDESEEMRRIIPVFEALKGVDTGAVLPALSVDSRKASVMEAALMAGAVIINDISALDNDGDSLKVAARNGCHVVLMHCRGEPKTMQAAPAYDHPVTEIYDYLETRINACEAAGIDRSRIAIDPGIGFGKALEHNLSIMSNMSLFHGLGCPILIGVSRKSFIGHITGEKNPKARLTGSIAAMISGLAQGVQMLRVHDVAATHQAIAVWQAINQNKDA